MATRKAGTKEVYLIYVTRGRREVTGLSSLLEVSQRHGVRRSTRNDQLYAKGA